MYNVLNMQLVSSYNGRRNRALRQGSKILFASLFVNLQEPVKTSSNVIHPILVITPLDDLHAQTEFGHICGTANHIYSVSIFTCTQ